VHQVPVDVGDLLQVFFDLAIALNPPANLIDLIAWHQCNEAPIVFLKGSLSQHAPLL